jgi:hypothetical protein
MNEKQTSEVIDHGEWLEFNTKSFGRVELLAHARSDQPGKVISISFRETDIYSQGAAGVIQVFSITRDDGPGTIDGVSCHFGEKQ